MEEKVVVVYKFEELSKDVQDKVVEWIGDKEDLSVFEEGIMENLRYNFPNSDMKVQYSLTHSQGDGVNIYGDLLVSDALNWEALKGKFTEGQVAKLLDYADEYKDKMFVSKNYGYAYCIADTISYADDLIVAMEEAGIEDIDTYLIEKFENHLIMAIKDLCNLYESQGYEEIDYHYTRDFVAEECEANDYRFLADGRLVDFL